MMLGFAVGRKATLLSDKAKRGERRQPVKPCGRIRLQVQFAFLRADDHIDSRLAVFDQRGVLATWDIRLGIGMLRPMEQASLPKHVRCEYNQ